MRLRKINIALVSVVVMLLLPGIAAEAQKTVVRMVMADGSVSTKTVHFSRKADHMELIIPKNLLSGVDTLEVNPDFAHAKAGEQGYFVSPDGYMTRFLSDRKDTLRAVYKNHPIAMAGVKTPRGCWAEMFETYRFDLRTIVSLKDGVYNARLQYILKNVEPYEDLVLKVYPLEGEDADYSGMGRLYRRLYVEGKIQPLSQRASENPLLEYAVNYPEIRIRQAWKPVPTPVPDQTRENEPSVRVKVTFDRCRELVDALKKGGVNCAQLTLVGWNYKGHDGRFPTVFPAEITLGGETALKKLIRYAQDEGYQIVPHICTGDSYKVSEDFDPDDLAVLPNGEYDAKFVYGSGRMYKLCNKVAYEKFVCSINDSLRAYGFRGLEYNDVYSTIPPVVCNNPDHRLNAKESTEYAIKILEDGRRKIGGIASEGGYDHVASALDFALYVSMSGPKTNPGRLKDEYVPIWHIIYNGYIFSCPFSQSVNYTIKPSNVGMKVIEYGCHPTFYFYSAHRDDNHNWIGTKDLDLKCETNQELEKSVQAIREGYDYLKEYGYIQYLTMDRHDMIAPAVYRSLFSDGTETVCNYSDIPYIYKGVSVAPGGWHIYKADNNK